MMLFPNYTGPVAFGKRGVPHRWRQFAAGLTRRPLTRSKVMTMRIAVTFLACALIWGSTCLAIRFGNEATPPVWAATIRLTLASILLFGIAAAFRMPLPRGAALRGAALWGFFNLGVNFALLYSGETTVPSGISAVLFASVPLTTAILAALFGVQRLVARKLIAALVAIARVALILPRQLRGS